MKNTDYFIQSLKHADSIIEQIKSNEWQASTPCSEWSLHDLVNHMVYELVWVPDILAGNTIEQIGNKYEGDLLKNNALLSWQEAKEKAISAALNSKPSGIVHLSYKDSTADEYIADVATDILIHSWDVMRAIGTDETLPAELVELCYTKILPHAKSLANTGMYSKPIRNSVNADAQAKLLAIFGRKQ